MPDDVRKSGAAPGRRRGRPATVRPKPATKASGKGSSAAGDGGVRSLNRALSLLEDVSAHSEGVTLGDLASHASLAPSTAHRLLKSLEARRFVTQDAERGLWFAGVQAFIVGTGFLRNRDVVGIARPFMFRAMEESGESINLAILDGEETIYLSQVESRQMMRALAPPGGRAPLHASGVGKAMLAGLTPEAAKERCKLLGFGHYTDKTLRDAASLLADIAAARRRGYAIDDEEHAVGLRCVAAPVFNEFGEPVAAISLSGPQARIPDSRLPDLGEKILRAANAITTAIGGKASTGFGG